MTSRIPFTAASLARAIKGVEQAGEKVVGVRPDGKLVLESDGIDLLNEGTRNYVYFISDGEFVKIGFSLGWKSRLKEIQANNPRNLEVLAVFDGDRSDEYALHQRFAAHRVRNEWFHHCDEIREYLESRRGECLKEIEP